MKLYSMDYTDTFFSAAPDSPATTGEAPPEKDPKTAVRIQYEMLVDSPYVHTSDDVLFASHGERRGMSREEYLGKRQP